MAHEDKIENRGLYARPRTPANWDSLFVEIVGQFGEQEFLRWASAALADND